MPNVKLQLNLGWLDVKRHSLPEGNAGDVLAVDDRQRHVLVDLLKCAVDCDPPKSLRDEVLSKEQASREKSGVETPKDLVEKPAATAARTTRRVADSKPKDKET